MFRWLNDWCAVIVGVLLFLVLCNPHIQYSEGESKVTELKRG